MGEMCLISGEDKSSIHSVITGEICIGEGHVCRSHSPRQYMGPLLPSFNFKELTICRNQVGLNSVRTSSHLEVENYQPANIKRGPQTMQAKRMNMITWMPMQCYVLPAHSG